MPKPSPPPMRFKTAAFEVTVKMKPSGNLMLIREPQILMKTSEGEIIRKIRTVEKEHFEKNGQQLQVNLQLSESKLIEGNMVQQPIVESEALHILDNYTNRFITEGGREVEADEIFYYEVKEDGTQIETAPFEATRIFDVSNEVNWIPATQQELFVVNEVYEIFAENKYDAMKLFEEAEKRYKEDKVCIIPFAHTKGFKAYYAFIGPHFAEGKFIWLLKKVEKKPVYNFLQDPPVAPKVPIREVPTVSVLPPISALVVAAPLRKKKKE